VVVASVRSVYAAKGEEPHVAVELRTITGDP
jgi:hypothetical protein